MVALTFTSLKSQISQNLLVLKISKIYWEYSAVSMFHELKYLAVLSLHDLHFSAPVFSTLYWPWYTKLGRHVWQVTVLYSPAIVQISFSSTKLSFIK